ncbi:glycosyltransferase family 8 protein [Thermocoleostomius sinensis]|uniref:Glycosyltransferase family 8 protein n=1 Tax=Thermocoleostomius sinensis A174 TaxID=2016057 RepID=A0A9E8Z8L3_9CYAN|nr:glycosyltransferase family 8 protein [Thermocoleostomius sinensis]WAL58312.1 glycosyltransferase family 8 protein [Thermocoleostomius sinensis A174]
MSTPAKTICLACAADDFYAMPLGVTVYSALANLSHDCYLKLFVLDDGIRNANKRKLAASLDADRVTIEWIQPPIKQIKQICDRSASPYPKSAYLRLLLPDIVPDEVEKVIYLDTDIVVTGNLETLWNLEIDNQALLAVQDPVHRFVNQAHHLKSFDLNTWGITSEHRYLNSGVLVMNLNKWRSEKLADRIMNFMSQHSELLFPDQDGLSIILANDWGELEPRWNQVHVVHSFSSWRESPYHQEMFENVLHHPYVIHFTSRPKPWMPGCTHPHRGVFLHYLQMTAWAGWTNTKWNYTEQLFRRSVRRFIRLAKQFYRRMVPTWTSTPSVQVAASDRNSPKR